MSPLITTLLVLVVASCGGAIWWIQHSSRKRALGNIASIDALLATGDLRAAADATITALAAHGDGEARVALRRRLARVLALKEEYDAAIRACSEAAEDAESDPERAEILSERARCQALSGDMKSAAADVERAGGLRPSVATRLELDLIAVDLALVGHRFEEAERALASAFGAPERGPLAAEIGLSHARLQFARGNFRQCIAEVSRILEDLPSDDLQAFGLVVLARALLEQEHPDAVGADHAISRASVIVHYAGLAAGVTACQALVLAHFKNEDEAAAGAAQAPGMTTSPRFRVLAHCLSGDALRQLGRFADARTHYQTALTIEPSTVEALWGLGSCALAFGMFEVAETYLTLCADTAPDHFLGKRAEETLSR